MASSLGNAENKVENLVSINFVSVQRTSASCIISVFGMTVEILFADVWWSSFPLDWNLLNP